MFSKAVSQAWGIRLPERSTGRWKKSVLFENKAASGGFREGELLCPLPGVRSGRKGKHWRAGVQDTLPQSLVP